LLTNSRFEYWLLQVNGIKARIVEMTISWLLHFVYMESLCQHHHACKKKRLEGAEYRMA
jgi:hypothetical protein